VNSPLLGHFQVLCDRALRAKPTRGGRDIDSLLDAFGYLIWLTALGETPDMPRASTPALRRLAQRALLAQHADDQLDDPEDRAHANKSVAEILRVGVRILDAGRATNNDVHHDIHPTALHPPTATLARMFEGKADGLTTGRYALHMLGCARCQNLLKALPADRSNVALAAPIQLAASPTARVRAPADGRVVAKLKTPKAEAVLFQDPDARRLAVYTSSTEPLRIVADGVTTEDTRPGYWIGRLASNVREIDGTVHYVATDRPRSSSLHITLDPKAKTKAKAAKPQTRGKPRKPSDR